MQPAFERLPVDVFSVAQVRAMDSAAIGEYGIAGYTLMTRAAAAALHELRLRWPDAGRLRIYCGLGNNAGDGYVLARLARRAGIEVAVIQCAPAEALSGDAARAHGDCLASGVEPVPFSARGACERNAVIVDAMFGTGLSRPLEGVFASAVEEIAATGLPVFALDVPSGINADTGGGDGPAVRADATIAFVGLKTGYFLGAGPEFCGELSFAGLELPESVRSAHVPRLRRLAIGEIRHALPSRSRLAHKGDNGRVLLVGGGPGMGGAIRMAAEAALRSGAGLVYVATHPENVATVVAQRPEIIAFGVETPAHLTDLKLAADAIVIGPGLGRSQWAAGLCHWAAGQTVPLVIDADALNWLAEHGAIGPRSGAQILTPHPGEAGRLLGLSTAAIQHDRLAAATELAERYAATAVLKGACTLIADPGPMPPAVCLAGNPGMATGGTGDILAGLIGGVLVQCRDVAAAARAGTLIHALAGDAAAAAGERGLIATDLLAEIRPWLNLR